MGSLVLNAEKRSETGKNVNRRLRSAGSIPAIIYSHGDAQSVSVDTKEFSKLFKGHISESVIITIKLDGEDVQVFVKDYQMHPVTDKMVHIDFFKVTEGEKINTVVAVEFFGSPKGVLEGGVFEVIEREIEVAVLPAELPEKIVCDTAGLNVGDSIHIGDLVVPESMTFKQDESHVLAHVIAPKAVSDENEEEVEEEGVAPTEA